jgi:hypothetical protein
MIELESVAARPDVNRDNLYKEMMLAHLDVIAKRVVAVENYTVNDEPIKDGADLVARGEKEFIDDIYKALTNLSYLSEGASKN